MMQSSFLSLSGRTLPDETYTAPDDARCWVKFVLFQCQHTTQPKRKAFMRSVLADIIRREYRDTFIAVSFLTPAYQRQRTRCLEILCEVALQQHLALLHFAYAPTRNTLDIRNATERHAELVIARAAEAVNQKHPEALQRFLWHEGQALPFGMKTLGI